MARANCLLFDRFLILIGIALSILLLFSIKYELSKIISAQNFREIKVEYLEKSDLICPQSSKGSFPRRDYYLTVGFHTVKVGAGIGNQLFELISIIGISYSLGRVPLLTATDATLISGISNKIIKKFPLLIEQFVVKIVEPSPYFAIPLNQRECCKYENVSLLAHHDKMPLLLLDGYYFQSFKYFDHLRSDIRRWLSPLRSSTRKAKEHLSEAYINDKIICTHIRRGDFTDDGVHDASDPNFTRQATEYLVRKYSNVTSNLLITVVILGNSPLWAQAVFHDVVANVHGFDIPRNESTSLDYRVVITPTLAPEIDLAFSNKFCDVVLLTAPSSTFGWWLAYLAKSEAQIYYRDINETSDRVLLEMNPGDFYPPNWIKLQSVQIK